MSKKEPHSGGSRLPGKLISLVLLIFIGLTTNSYSLFLLQRSRASANNVRGNTKAGNAIANSGNSVNSNEEPVQPITDVKADKLQKLKDAVQKKRNEICATPGPGCNSIKTLQMVLNNLDKLNEENKTEIEINCQNKFDEKKGQIPAGCETLATNVLETTAFQLRSSKNDDLPVPTPSPSINLTVAGISFLDSPLLYGLLIIILLILAALVFVTWQNFANLKNLSQTVDSNVFTPSKPPLYRLLSEVKTKVTQLSLDINKDPLKIEPETTITPTEQPVETEVPTDILQKEISQEERNRIEEELREARQNQQNIPTSRFTFPNKILNIINNDSEKVQLILYPAIPNALKQRSNDSETTSFYLIKEQIGSEIKLYAIPIHPRIGKEMEFSVYKNFYLTENKTFNGDLEILEPAEVERDAQIQGWQLKKQGKIRFV